MFFQSLPRLGVWRPTIVRCGDNTGIVKGCVIGIQNQWGTGKIGDRVRLSVRDKTEHYNGPKLPKAIIIRRKCHTLRKDGSYIKFDENAFAVIAKNKPRGTKIKGPVSYELQNNAKHIAKWIF